MALHGPTLLCFMTWLHSGALAPAFVCTSLHVRLCLPPARGPFSAPKLHSEGTVTSGTRLGCRTLLPYLVLLVGTLHQAYRLDSLPRT